MRGSIFPHGMYLSKISVLSLQQLGLSREKNVLGDRNQGRLQGNESLYVKTPDVTVYVQCPYTTQAAMWTGFLGTLWLSLGQNLPKTPPLGQSCLVDLGYREEAQTPCKPVAAGELGFRDLGLAFMKSHTALGFPPA